ncbi:MAG: hypothetical protein KAR38_00975 [Calditrichia bacterium]|nr:hypothetical protein [Calditrichia bacterium]
MKILNQFIIILIIIILSCAVPIQFYGLTQEKYEYIKKETISGKLNLSKSIDKSKIDIIEGKGYAYDWFALYGWGKSVKELGIKKSSHAISLYEEIIGKKIDKRLKKAIKKGFNNG